ncbi:hypothetical protein E2C01_046396 [Portunus trituberculatus]|uniref:Uncharacterized protein n=1 Tax=Portunus trituberculatus TaxID=210409 RepID=A0A5B7G529_PORTR|nr:hypothetical protein [Portunus trituberculatus]
MDCNGRFAKQYYEDYFSRPVCRLCDTRSHLEEAVAEGNWRFAELKGNFDSLQDTRTRLEEAGAEGNNRYTELNNIFDTLQEFITANIGRSATTDSLPHTSVAPATADSRSRPSLSTDPAFIPVRNGARSLNKWKKHRRPDLWGIPSSEANLKNSVDVCRLLGGGTASQEPHCVTSRTVLRT